MFFVSGERWARGVSTRRQAALQKAQEQLHDLIDKQNQMTAQAIDWDKTKDKSTLNEFTLGKLFEPDIAEVGSNADQLEPEIKG